MEDFPIRGHFGNPIQSYKQKPDRNTLMVYWFLCSKRRGAHGPRTVQRALGFSSPSTAVFHLEKLIDMGLVQKLRNGQYKVTRYEKFGLMKSFFRFGSWWIPKHLIYALVTTMAIVIIICILFSLISWLVVFSTIPALIAATIQWYEAVILWRKRPSFKEI